MGITAKSLLKDKRVLYAVAGLSALNMIGWMSNRRHESLIVFFIVMLIATRFTKNMIIIIGSALLVANILVVSRNGGYMEGVDETLEKDEDKDEDKDEEKVKEKFGMEKKEKKEGAKNMKDKEADESEAFSSGKHDLDFAATLDQAYGRIDKMLGADGGKKWGDHMDKLFKKQNSLLNNLNQMEPVLDKMSKMADKTKGMESIMGKVMGGGK
jgi:hypothetical protein